jgi:hypothetical protein
VAEFDPQMPFRSRYKDTARFDGPRGEQYTPYERPGELEGVPPDRHRLHRLTQADNGFLDAVAFLHYGSEDLWWVIADANGMIDVEAETRVGMPLAVPSPAVVRQMLQRRGSGGW